MSASIQNDVGAASSTVECMYHSCLSSFFSFKMQKEHDSGETNQNGQKRPKKHPSKKTCLVSILLPPNIASDQLPENRSTPSIQYLVAIFNMLSFHITKYLFAQEFKHALRCQSVSQEFKQAFRCQASCIYFFVWINMEL